MSYSINKHWSGYNSGTTIITGNVLTFYFIHGITIIIIKMTFGIYCLINQYLLCVIKMGYIQIHLQKLVMI
jgi:hypothetical protein